MKLKALKQMPWQGLTHCYALCPYFISMTVKCLNDKKHTSQRDKAIQALSYKSSTAAAQLIADSWTLQLSTGPCIPTGAVVLEQFV